MFNRQQCSTRERAVHRTWMDIKFKCSGAVHITECRMKWKSILLFKLNRDMGWFFFSYMDEYYCGCEYLMIARTYEVQQVVQCQ